MLALKRCVARQIWDVPLIPRKRRYRALLAGNSAFRTLRDRLENKVPGQDCGRVDG